MNDGKISKTFKELRDFSAFSIFIYLFPIYFSHICKYEISLPPLDPRGYERIFRLFSAGRDRDLT